MPGPPSGLVGWGCVITVGVTTVGVGGVALNKLAHVFKKCTKLTALCLLEMNQACWKARNAHVVEKGGWEESVGIVAGRAADEYY